MAETWRKLKTFYYAHRDAIWRYGSACALVAVAWLLDWPTEAGFIAIAFGVVSLLPDDAWSSSGPWSLEQYNDWLDSLGPVLGQPQYTYNEYISRWHNMHGGSSNEGPWIENQSMPWMPTVTGGTIDFSFTNITEAAKNALQTFMEEVPHSREFMEFYLPHIMSLMKAQPEAYEPGFDLAAGANEKKLMDMQMARLGQIPDIASAYDQAYDNYLPVYQRRYQENTLKPAQEQLAALGMEGSSAGMDYVGKLGEEQSITEAGLWQDMQLGKAGAQQQMFNLQGTQLGAAWDMSGREAQRSYDTQRMEYADWLRQTGQQAELASMLGTPTYNTMLGTMGSVYSTGLSSASGLASSGISAGASRYAANAGLAGQQYAAQMGLYSQQLEQQFMAPYLEMASQPVQISSGGKK